MAIGGGRRSESSERVRKWAWGLGLGRIQCVLYEFGRAKGSTAGTWRRPVKLGLGVGETGHVRRAQADRPQAAADRPRDG